MQPVAFIREVGRSARRTALLTLCEGRRASPHPCDGGGSPTELRQKVRNLATDSESEPEEVREICKVPFSMAQAGQASALRSNPHGKRCEFQTDLLD